MRSRFRDKQDIWVCSIKEQLDGLDKISKYSKPVKFRKTVSTTSGTPEEISAGIVPAYDRYITSFTEDFNPTEGDLVFIDVVPKLDESGELIMCDDGITPIVCPDYVIKKTLATQKGNVRRFGVKKYGKEDI